MFDPLYESQVRLLLHCLPEVTRHACFALKGGTALNFFMRDMPRLSVDIDLTYIPLKPREDALREIHDTLLSIRHDIEQRIPDAQVRERRIERHAAKLFVSAEDAVVKIEPNLILRGSVYEPERRDLCPAAQERFEVFVNVQSLSSADLYGGKLCAALDRQHPRDFFDVKLLLDTTGVTAEIRRAFVVYLAGHNRPMSELLAPQFQDIAQLHADHFSGMARDEVPIDDLLQVQRDLPGALLQALDDDEKAFLVSVKRGEPEWDRLGIDHLNQLPAIQWKLINIRRMSPAKHKAATDRLVGILEKG